MDAESNPPAESQAEPVNPEEPSDNRDDAPTVEDGPSAGGAAGPEASHPEAPKDSSPSAPPGLFARVWRWFTTDLDGR
ncbi:hypothetical protein BO221_14085 [Archangium sp. Cb G35]|nr:hypothetical protein BO221_14085 [Archangium sp. Cb G35]